MRFVHALRLLAVLVMLGAPAAFAVEPDEILPDPVLEARARALSLELRCLVCQNQSIDDSNAPLARDLRLLVRERLKSGESDAEVRSFVVARYGDFVLLRPPVNAATIALWLTPVLVLALASFMVWRQMRRQGSGKADRLTDAEETELARVIEYASQGSGSGARGPERREI